VLEDACVRGRRVSEQAARAAVGSLGVTAERPPAHLGADDRQLRRGLRAKALQLGDQGDRVDLLVGECAYEQWHRLLFSRFLAENNLLIHPEYRAPVTLEDCEELAESLGEPDGWSVAGRFAAEILPGIFRLADPCVQLRLAPEGRLALEAIVSSLPADVFVADDALGWVYQFWQKEKKDEVNRSERKIGGADLGPVTQLFTENYMVRFLLENSLGAWWAARHPHSPLVKEWEYLRVDDDGVPAAGSFEGWPDRVAEVTVMDPCCGSGHFLVEAFGMLWQMRAEEEGLDALVAQDAVLRDNLFGLELDPRCVQIAMFAVAVQAWKAGGGWRELPVPNIACSGIPVKAPVDEWKALAGSDERLEKALVRLHILFRDADTLGSLIDPKRTVEIASSPGSQQSFEDVEWDDIAPLLAKALTAEADDPATAVLGAEVAGLARAADYLSRAFTLICTNVPFLSLNRQTDMLKRYIENHHHHARHDLAAVFIDRWWISGRSRNSIAVVGPSQWLFLVRYESMRRRALETRSWALLVRLGMGAFTTTLRASPSLLIGMENAPLPDQRAAGLDAEGESTPERKSTRCRTGVLTEFNQSGQLLNPDARILLAYEGNGLEALSTFAVALEGVRTGDSPRFDRLFWEVAALGGTWERLQSSVGVGIPYGGRSKIIRWEDEQGDLAAFAESVRHLNHAAQNWRSGKPSWGRKGVAVSLMGDLLPTLYSGDRYDPNCCAIVPLAAENLAALWAFAASGDLNNEVRKINQAINVTPNTLLKIPFDLEHWRRVAEESGPLPEPWSDDPTQWLFEGRPEVASEPLQVGVGRLLGYRWPEQAESDDLDGLADDDGIVCVPSVRGERTAAERLQELLARAFGGTWSPARTQELLAESGSKQKDLESWLRDDFFKAHCQVFKNRPFVWHVWDGRKDGFAALVNYHRLNRPTLEKLTYSYVGDWIERQTAGVRDDVAGAEERLAAARLLQQKLELILEGEPPYDIYVRWKSLAEQPIGWEPDLNDGVRLNVRPFVEAGVLRSTFNVKWGKDRGKNPDGSERINDLHYPHAEKRAARRESA
jgi:hypothetical protein